MRAESVPTAVDQRFYAVQMMQHATDVGALIDDMTASRVGGVTKQFWHLFRSNDQ
jgi:hypothetical protein